MMNKLRNILLYGNADKESFKNVYDAISVGNRSNLYVYLGIAIVGMACMVFASFFDQSLEKNRMTYVICVMISFLMGVILKLTDEKNHTITYICVYLFAGLMFTFGILLGTYIEPNQLSVSFPILLFAVPLFFTDIPIRMNIAVVIAIFVYMIAAIKTQNMQILGYNISNILPYGCISIILSSYMMQIKIRRYVLEYENKFLIESDQLTGMFNRRCYEQHLQILRKHGCADGMLICSFDVNGLKKVNDTIGHHAGDELIRGASNCIRGVFGSYGHCYRVGGDEFVAILDNVGPTTEELKESLSRRCSCFNGSYVAGLSISTGIVSAQKGDSVDELLKIADKKMYEDKNRHYENVGKR